MIKPTAGRLLAALACLTLIGGIFVPSAEAGMVWGFEAPVFGVASNADHDIYLSTPEGVYKIAPNVTLPQAFVELPRAKQTRPIAASLHGSVVAIATRCDTCEDHNEVLLTDGDLSPLRRIEGIQIANHPAYSDGQLFLSNDDSHLYVRMPESVAAFDTSEGDELWSVRCSTGSHPRVYDTQYVAERDWIGYLCVDRVPAGFITIATIVDGSTGLPLWSAAIPDWPSKIRISESGNWIQVSGAYAGGWLYEYPSVTPEPFYERPSIRFLSEDDRFINLVPTEERDGLARLEWHAAPIGAEMPEVINTRDGRTKIQPLNQDGQSLLIQRVSESEPIVAPPDWEHDMMFNSFLNYTFQRFDRDGELLETGRSTQRTGDFLALPNSLSLIIYMMGSHVSLFEPDTVNRRPLIENCTISGDFAHVDVMDPDGDEFTIHWNFSNYLWLYAGPLRMDLIDATGPSTPVPDDVRQVGIIAVDERGAISVSGCGKPTEDSAPAPEAAGLAPALVITFCLIGAFALRRGRTSSRS